jgi:organic radical activating enzyme
VETNGTLPLKFAKPKNLFISCSPKTPKIVVEADWWKLLVPDKLDLLEKIIDSQKPIYLQPVEPRMPDGSVDHEAFQRNIAQCARLAMSDGYRVCLQLHKILNLR